ncbi:MAG: hypothetical protein IJO48_05195 [Clostridia bacterium]|nr:hypothetical protein [Clostridia bacterium]
MNKLNALWLYHEAVCELDKLEMGVRSTPSRLKLNKLHAFLTEQQSQLTSIQKQLDTKEAVVERLTAKVNELEKACELEASEFEVIQNDEESTAAELTEARSSIEKVLKEVAETRRELFDAIAWIEKAVTEYREMGSKASRAKKEYDVLRAECEKEQEEAKPAIAAAREKADKLKKDVEAVLLEKYTFIKTRHAVPMAKVANNQCGGCNMSLPTSVVKRVASGDGIVECENCGRILYTE